MADGPWIFDSAMPSARAGSTITVSPHQTVDAVEDGTFDGKLGYLAAESVHLRVDGPRFSLTPEDVVGVYPAPGSDESSDEFLPHIALRRRTLPWERRGPTQTAGGEPWLALLLVTEDDFDGAAAVVPRSVASLETDDRRTFEQLTVLEIEKKTEVRVAKIKAKSLDAILPERAELALLCHVKRTAAGPREGTAIVISNRLPQAAGGKPHTALLVSLEGRDDVYERTTPIFAPLKGSIALIVLHHWTFTPSAGGDFEQVIRSIGVRPNGGVLRFGNVPENVAKGAPAPLSGGFDAVLDGDGFPIVPLEHTQDSPDAVFRGPLRPFPAPARDRGFAIRAAPEEFADEGSAGPKDYSHAAAFEVGRLLALQDPAIQDDLRAVRPDIPPLEQMEIIIDPLPPALVMPDWRINDEWHVHPWEVAEGQSVLKGPEALLDLGGVADVTGVAEQLAGLAPEVMAGLEQLAQPLASKIAAIDLQTATAPALEAQFGAVKNVAGG